MNAHPSQKCTSVFPLLMLLGLIGCIALPQVSCLAQDMAEQARSDDAQGNDGVGTLIIKARGEPPEPKPLFSARAIANAQVSQQSIEQLIQLSVKMLQGHTQSFSFGLLGSGDVIDVQGESVKSWAIRNQGSTRFLDIRVTEKVGEWRAEIKTRTPIEQLPVTADVTHLGPGDSIGFDSVVKVSYAPDVEGKVTSAAGFAPLEKLDSTASFQTATGGKITLSLARQGAAPGPVELVDASLTGSLHANGNSIHFQLQGTAQVTQPGAEIIVLAGNAAVSQVPQDAEYRLRLSSENGQDVYKLVFEQAGTFPVVLDFVAKLVQPASNLHSMDFTIAASAIVPLTLKGLDSDLEFHRDQESVVPSRREEAWLGFLPATGRAKLQWKTARKTGEGKLFFTTTGRVEAKIGTGLLRQDHTLDYQVLQGELKSIRLLLLGPGEILDVQGNNIVAWKVSPDEDNRQLDITLSQPITAASQINIRSQTPLGAFPVRVQGLRISPIGAIRHSGFLRLTNLGSVRLEPTELSGLTQLSPQQYPGDAIEARQVFVYRFPAAEHEFTVDADRIQPEVNIAALVLYELAETDRVIKADVELDIREAAIREWDFRIPADYSVVSVNGASVADYITGSEATEGRRNLKVIFAEDVVGRQLVSLHLEKGEAATAADWALPRIEFPEAKTVRGDIGIIGAPGFRIAIQETDLLVEKPLSYFPKPTPDLQQAFRIRQPDWSATVRIELLDRSVQSDVFHLYSLTEDTIYGSGLVNYFVTGAPVSEWRIAVPATLGNVMVDGQDVRTWRREDDTLIVSLHQPVMGAYTLLVTFEEKPDAGRDSFTAGQIAPLGVQGERGYIQVVSSKQVEIETIAISEDILKLDPLELPAEFRLLSTAPPLGTWQYTQRPFNLGLRVQWFEPGTTVDQVVEFSEANSRVSQDGELVTDVLYYVKSRGQRTLRIKLPDAPVRLWEVSVGGQPVTARQAENETLIPLPGGTDPNTAIEVRLRIGKPSVDEFNPRLTLPIVFAPVLKTQWDISSDEKHILVASGGTVTPAEPVLRPSGFYWLAKRGIPGLLLIGFFIGVGIWGCGKRGVLRFLAVVSLAAGVWCSLSTAYTAQSETAAPSPLQLNLPVLAAGETVELQATNMPLWLSNLSWIGLAVVSVGLICVGVSLFPKLMKLQRPLRCAGIFAIGLGVLLQGDGAPWFFALLALAIFVLLFIPPTLEMLRGLANALTRSAERRKARLDAVKEMNKEKRTEDVGSVPTALIFLALSFTSASTSMAAAPDGFRAADSIKQQWNVTHQDARLVSNGSIRLSGRPGDRFLLLRAPAVLTQFEGEGLRLDKVTIPGQGLCYIVSIPVLPQKTDTAQVPGAGEVRDDQAAADSGDTPDTDASDDNVDSSQADATSQDSDAPNSQDAAQNPAIEIERQPSVVPVDYQATFEFQLEAIKPLEGMPVLTGPAALQEIDFRYDEAGWDVLSPTAVQVESIAADDATQARVLLGPGNASLLVKPQARDVTMEETRFFVEAANLYLPGPGVVDGRHRLHVRVSQGQVTQLSVLVPAGLTVSGVSGPVGAWQFDADSGRLKLEVEPSQAQAFDILIESQRSLDLLPVDVTLAPLEVEDATGEVGLLGIAFGPEAQPEKLQPSGMSAVNLGDFDAGLIPNQQSVLHRVYRYGAEGGELIASIGPVDPEVRVISKQVLSLGDERVTLGVNFATDISRAGLFQLSFPLPAGLEVESLSGASLHHWSELTQAGQRQIVLHLNGKTIGRQTFSLTLSGAAPTEVGDWEIPRFVLAEAARQNGELVIKPTTGIRLRTTTKQNVSETDPRLLGGQGQGALAFRLLQRDWNLVLEIEKLAPWITGQVLHDLTLREGQTRSALLANFNVQNASIRTLQVVLPITDEDEIKTIRASGNTVSDFVRTAADSNLWEVQFKQRVVGNVQFQIEYERRGDRQDESETLVPAGFPQAKQLAYYFGIRAGGRLELQHDPLTAGWQRVDWTSVPSVLRDAGNRNAPALSLRAVNPANGLIVHARRHSLADALKLRVAKGTLNTILSPTGDQLTAVDVTIEVIQRSSLSVGLPEGGQLFSIFVNGESVNSIRLGGTTNAWQFYILPGINDRTAEVRFVYSVAGDSLRKLSLRSPELNVPLENIQWQVVAPKGFELTDDEGNLELVSQSNQAKYDRDSYLNKAREKRKGLKDQAEHLLEQANQLLQLGQQGKARWALNSVANQYALDAASNEDARVQLENLQTQQAIVGLNTRRQRLYLDNNRNGITSTDNQQLREAAANNPLLQQDEINFRPQELSQFLGGNTNEDNVVLQQIAARLVQHQRTTDPAPQAIIISMPEEGSVYTFSRSVQVTENAPLALNLEFGLERRLKEWQTAGAACLLLAMAAALAWMTCRQPLAPSAVGKA